jgi:hypothetical protein
VKRDGERSPDRRFMAAVEALPAGYSRGTCDGRRWGVTLDASIDGRRRWLYGEALDGSDHVSFNLYRLAAGPALRPCEMPVEKVVRFVLGYVPDAQAGERDAMPGALAR